MNSVARMDKPIGITIKAGPGKNIKKIPMMRMVKPTTAITILLIFIKFSLNFIVRRLLLPYNIKDSGMNLYSLLIIIF